MELLMTFLKLIGALAAPFRWVKSWREKRQTSRDDEMMRAVHVWLAHTTLAGKGDILCAEIGSDLYFLAEKMVGKQMLERFFGMPGRYTLPGRMRRG